MLPAPFTLADLPRDRLVAVVLEYMMVGHLIDRALMPQVAVRAGIDTVDDVAIDEWLGASPTYTARMRRLMGIEGDDVGAIMKGLQLDVGFVHQYMGVAYELTDARHGEFWLNHCGALMDVEPHGEARVVGMCHHIEDPTFDGTAVATNPHARIRPIHRPPRVPADREPHCHWTITIDPDNDPIDPAPHTLRVAELPLASVPNERPAGAEPGGRQDYRGPFDPEFRLADLSEGTLVAVAREFQEQVHMLTSSAELSLADRLDTETAREIVASQWIGAAWVASERLVSALGLEGGGIDAVARVLALHPAFPPGFETAVGVDAAAGRITLEMTPLARGLLDPSNPGWLGLLARGERGGVEAMARAVDRRARVDDVSLDDDRIVVELAVEETAPPAPEPPEVELVRLSGAVSWVFDATAGTSARR
ncbi:MAG TPA: hypothetical protein VFA62_05055 [Acidimicrobiia bacterium]|nr:hypothetical protein [Acidimicrobiia bacterium]